MSKIHISPRMPTEIEIVPISKSVAKIIAYPFQAGFAVTLAHPLRRLLYSSTVGYAPTAIKIEGVSHEFDSMRGMLEDVAMFIINLKQLRFKIKNNANKIQVSYSFSGPKEIFGKNLNNDDIEIVSEDLYLATINEDADLSFTLVIEKGMGYVPSEDIRDNYDDEFIVLDAAFTPVKKVVYNIENILIEDDPNFEKIIFDIETDGQVTPVEAFKNALTSMYSQMRVFNEVLKIDIVNPIKAKKESADISRLMQTISDLNLSARSFNCLERADIKYVAQIILMDETEIKNLKNLGKKSLEEIKTVFEEIGYPVGGKVDEDIRNAIKIKLEELKNNKEE